MAREIEVGDKAPNFDLASTEGVVLMLRDEVHRTQVLVYVFAEPEAATADLGVLARSADDLLASGIKILAVSEASLEDLATAQRDLRLPFPLLHDDRGLSRAYLGDGERRTVTALVGRDQRIQWLDAAGGRLPEDLPARLTAQAESRGSTVNYPRSVINGLVDRWVN